MKKKSREKLYNSFGGDAINARYVMILFELRKGRGESSEVRLPQVPDEVIPLALNLEGRKRGKIRGETFPVEKEILIKGQGAHSSCWTATRQEGTRVKLIASFSSTEEPSSFPSESGRTKKRGQKVPLLVPYGGRERFRRGFVCCEHT